MAYHAYISLNGGKSNSKGGPVHKMSYGPMAITPRNLTSALFQVKSQSDAGSGSLTGKRQHSPITIVREVDSSSPLLWQALCTNEVLKSVDLSFVQRPSSGSGEAVFPRVSLTNATMSSSNQYTPSLVGKPPSGSGEVVVSRVTLTNAAISKVNRYIPVLRPHGSGQSSSAAPDTNEVEEISFTFQKITYTNVAGSTSASDDWNWNP